MKTTMEDAIAELKSKRDKFNWMVEGLESNDINDLESRLMETEVLNALGGELRQVSFKKLYDYYMGERTLQELKMKYYDFERCIRIYGGSSYTRDIRVDFKSKTVEVGYDFMIGNNRNRYPEELCRFAIEQFQYYLSLIDEKRRKISSLKRNNQKYLNFMEYSLKTKIALLEKELKEIDEEDLSVKLAITEAAQEKWNRLKRLDTETIIDAFTSKGFELLIPDIQKEEKYAWFTVDDNERASNEHPLFAFLENKAIYHKEIRTHCRHFSDELGFFLEKTTVGICPTSLIPSTIEEQQSYFRSTDDLLVQRPITDREMEELKRLFKADKKHLKVENSPSGTLKLSHNKYPLTLTMDKKGSIVVHRLRNWGAKEPLSTRVGLQPFIEAPSFNVAAAVLDMHRMTTHYQPV